MQDKISKVFVAGATGMVGSSICRLLKSKPNIELLSPSRIDLDLMDLQATQAFFKKNKVDYVVIAAAKVGGIKANNDLPADFLFNNLTIQLNIINSAFESDVRNLIFLGSSCIYPKYCDQPMTEEYLLNGHLEPTNEAYAVAKIAGIKLCESYNRQFGVDYRSIMPTNLYGPGDNYHSEYSHVIPALIRKFYEAKISDLKQVTIWGSGKAKREFLMVDDLAAAIFHVMNLTKENYDSIVSPQLSHINVGSGEEITIRDLAFKISESIGFKGEINFDITQPDGSPRKLLDSTKLMKTGWKPQFNLDSGLEIAINDFEHNYHTLRIN